MKRFFRIFFRALILLVVALASALSAMRFAIHGREVSVPKFVGMAPAEADRLAADNGLLMAVENRFYSAEVPEGRIVTQSPPQGTKVRRGWRVRVAESMGPQRVSIPNVIGQSQRAAEINLTRRGLQVGTVAKVQLPDLAPDTVISQSPAPEITGITSPRVNLLIAAPPADANAVVMPDLVGKTVDEAARVIAAAGLKFGDVKTVAATRVAAPPAGAQARTALRPPIVTAQTPAPGSKVQVNSAVNLEVVR